MNKAKPREGEIYKIITVAGHHFTIRYGYYTDDERMSQEPIPIFPCFESQPLYCKDGFPLVTRIQDSCEHYLVQEGRDGDGWCADCVYYPDEHADIGVCQCAHRRCQSCGSSPSQQTNSEVNCTA